MGWYYGTNTTRADLVRELTDDATARGGSKTLRKFFSGNTLWTVQETATGERWIGCYLLHRAGHAHWGYKPLEESMGPAELTCPLAFLDEVPQASGPYATEWRAKVRAFQNRRSEMLAARRRARKAVHS